MARITTYLNFDRETEEAFNFYKRVFGTEFEGEPARYADMPASEDAPPIPEEDKNLIMHVALPVFDGYMLRGSDTPATMGHSLIIGNNTYIHLEVDSKNQADKLFNALKEGGTVRVEIAEQFWGDYFGEMTDKFGVKWMVSCPV